MKLAEIKKIIPHREPFIFIDEVIDIKPMDHATGIKYVSPDEYFFKGHFPQKPVMPGVIILEAMAQLGAVILLSGPLHQGKIGYFTGIKKARFRKQVLPGDTLKLYCKLTKIKGAFGYGEAKAFVGEDIVCEAEFSFVVDSK